MENLWSIRRQLGWSEASRRAALRLLGSAGLAALVGESAARAAKKKKGGKHHKGKGPKKKPNPPAPPPPTPDLTFPLTRAAAAPVACASQASGSVNILKLGFAERMEVTLSGLPANTEFDLFVIQKPTGPFGASWYQGDLTTNGNGTATESFIGRFNIETFIVSPGVMTPPPQVHTDPPNPDALVGIQTAPIHTYHVGVWFNSPTAECPASPLTPFNGDHTAGIQILNTSTFPDHEGPLHGVSD